MHKTNKVELAKNIEIKAINFILNKIIPQGCGGLSRCGCQVAAAGRRTDCGGGKSPAFLGPASPANAQRSTFICQSEVFTRHPFLCCRD